MPQQKPKKRLRRPVYKTVFHVTEELYESPAAKEPMYAHTVSGRFRIDLLRTLCIGTALLSAITLAGLLSRDR